MRRFSHGLTFALLLAATVTRAADIPVTAKKLLLKQSGNQLALVSKVAFKGKDLDVATGSGTDPMQISVQFRVMYANWYGKGEWFVDQGIAGWTRTDTGIRFRNPGFSGFPNSPKKLVIRQGKLLNLSGDLGYTWQHIVPAGDPLGSVYTAYCVQNGAEENCHCTEFPACAYTLSPAFDTRLQCLDGIGDPLCRARCSDAVDQGVTMLDSCSGLEWEQKDTVPGSGADPGNPQDVDNRYTWAGRCSLDTSVLCQPTPAAATLCATQTGGAEGCGECGAGEGTCDAALGGAITTVWDWLDGLNAATFGGHADWRLPTGGTGGASGATPIPLPSELSSLRDRTCSLPGPLCSGPDWYPPVALGPIANAFSWTSTTSLDDSLSVVVSPLFDSTTPKTAPGAVRAVRSAP